MNRRYSLERSPSCDCLQHFQIEPVSSRKHFLFNLLNFLYFRKSAYEDRLSIEIHPLSLFIAIPYIIFSEVYFFRQKRYFIIVRQQIIGLFALKQKAEALYISSLAASPLYRRMGVATCILNHALTAADQLQKKALELSVLKTNTPALRLYKKFGFRKKGEKRRSFTLGIDVKKQAATC